MNTTHRALLEPLATDSFSRIWPHERAPCVRLVTPNDTVLLANLIARLSDNSRWLRFPRPLPSAELIWQEAARVTQREPQLGMALVATVSEGGQTCAIALAELAQDRAMPATADLALMVRDDHQRQGLGTLLLRRLLDVADQRDVRTLRATLWAENWAARQLLLKLGLAYRTEMCSGELTVWLDRQRER